MRILMVNKFLYPRAGAETYMLELSKYLIKAGHEVAFFGMDHPEKTDLGPCCTVDLIELSAKKGAISKSLNLLKAMVQNLTIRKKFRQFCRDFGADIIHAHNVYNQLPASLFRGIDIPVIMTAHDYKPVCPSYNLFSEGQKCYDCLDGNFTHCVTKKCVHDSFASSLLAALSSFYHRQSGTYHRDIDHFVAPSEFMKNSLVAGGIAKEKIQVIHNFAKSTPEVSLPGDNYLYVGRICREKGVDTLLDAFEKLADPKKKLILCGTGPLKPQLEQISQRKGLNVEWRGFVSPAKVKEEMALAKTVIVPSLWNENCSMTIMESLAMGRPVIASNSGGNSELIEDGVNGFTFEAGDSSDLVTKIRELDKHSPAKLFDGSLETSKRFFSHESHLSAVLYTYQKIWEKNRIFKCVDYGTGAISYPG